MRKAAFMAGLMAVLAGTGALAQETAPEAAAPPDGAGMAEALPMEGHGPRGGLPGLAPIETYDTDGDGIVTQEEIEAERTARFAAADADGDGALSPEEMIAMEEARQEAARLARATQTVETMDDNGDGLLQAEEMEARMPLLAPIFDRLDTDGDDGISLAEIEAARPQRGEEGEGFLHGFFGRGGRSHGQDG